MVYENSWSYNDTNNTGTGHTLAVSGATAGNLLVACVAVRLGGDAFTTPTGYTLLNTESDGTFGCAKYYREATGTAADNFSPSWIDGGRSSSLVQEYSGLESSPIVIEDSAENIADISADVSSSSSGTATPTSSNGLAVVFFGLKDVSNWATDTAGTGITIVSGYSNIEFSAAATTAPFAILCSKTYNSIADISATISTTVLVGSCYGAITLFRATGGGTAIEEMYVKSGGTFVKHTPNVRVGGAWQEVDAYVKSGGAWVQVHEKP